MRTSCLAVFAVIISCCVLAAGQTSDSKPRVSNLIAVLTGTLDTRSVKTGDDFALNAISDLFVDGEVVIPRGSRLTGRIAEVTTKSKNEQQTTLAFSVEKATLKNGQEIPLQAIVAAVAAPYRTSLATDPTFGMMHSNEPKMVGGATTSSSSGTLNPSSKSSSNAAVAAANLNGKLDQPTVLNAESQGAVDIEGLTITWRLMAPPPITVIATKAKNLKLDNGTQMLLRLAPPRLPH